MAQQQVTTDRRSFFRRRRRWAWAALALVLAIIFLPEPIRVTLGPNFHTVLNERLYRAGQPSGASLQRYVRDLGIRTVINLRGPNDGEDWYEEEKLAAQRCGVRLVSITMSASDKPHEHCVRELVDTFDSCATPILLHCSSGSDRSGFASVCYLLMKTPATPEEARAQLSLRYGHIKWGPAGCLDHILDKYRDWLVARGEPHQPDRFRLWAREAYVKDDWPPQ